MSVDDVRERPAHLRPALVGAVALGGTIGTAARLAVLAVAPASALPLAILLINVTGAFALGALLTQLGMRGPDVGRRRTLRLLLGTGVLGGYTTYSQLALDTVDLVVAGSITVAVLYAAGTLVLGVGAAAAGARIARSAHTARGRMR